MANTTYLDDLINYKHTVIKSLADDQGVVGLLLNDPHVDMESDAAYDVVGNVIFDFDYVDRTVQRTDAYIMVDAEMVNPTSGTMHMWRLYVQVVCEKGYNKLDHKIFKGVRGNRRDNLARQIDLLINGRRDFGIGELELHSVTTATVPDTFTSVLLTYTIHDFNQSAIKRAR